MKPYIYLSVFIWLLITTNCCPNTRHPGDNKLSLFFTYYARSTSPSDSEPVSVKINGRTVYRTKSFPRDDTWQDGTCKLLRVLPKKGDILDFEVKIGNRDTVFRYDVRNVDSLNVLYAEYGDRFYLIDNTGYWLQEDKGKWPAKDSVFIYVSQLSRVDTVFLSVNDHILYNAPFIFGRPVSEIEMFMGSVPKDTSVFKVHFKVGKRDTVFYYDVSRVRRLDVSYLSEGNFFSAMDNNQVLFYYD